MWHPTRYLCALVLVKYCCMQVVDVHTLEHLIRKHNGQVTTPGEQVVSALEAYERLSDDILNRLVVRKKIPPSLSRSKDVFLHMEPLQLNSVNEVAQSIHLSHITDVRWFDPNLIWDPLLYNNISHLEIATSSVWTPRLVLPKSITDGTVTFPDRLTLMSNGQLVSSIPGYIDSSCPLDLTYFPLDQHTCAIVFLGQSTYKLLPDISPSHVDVSMYFTDGTEWSLLQHGCSSKRDTVSSVECFVSIKRRSTFYVANLIIPMLFTSAMTLIVFWLPAESGEKISFLVSVFVSCSVFLNYIVETIPRSMGSLPRINALLIFVVVKVIVSTAATAVVLRRYNNTRFLKRGVDGMHDYQQKNRQLERVMLARAHDSASMGSVYYNSSHTQEAVKEKDILKAEQERKITVSGQSWRLTRVVSWWCGLSHSELDRIFFAVLSSVTLVTYSALLFM